MAISPVTTPKVVSETWKSFLISGSIRLSTDRSK